ncbi:MAG: adenylate/guanylate cyclase domain-containing protein [Acidimicrobiales bacterium]
MLTVLRNQVVVRGDSSAATVTALVCTGSLVDESDFEALGLFERGGEHAELRLELLRYLTELGATADELVAYRDALPGLAMVLAVRGGPAMTLDEAAQRSGLGAEEIRRLTRAAGFADPAPEARVFTEGFVALAAGLGAVSAVFGEASLYQLLRVLGSAMARVADAVVSAFLVNVEPSARRLDPVGLAVARANVEAATLLPMVAPALDVLFRQHLLAAQRTVIADEDLVGYETQRLTVGFVDLVGSTELGERLSMNELGSVLTSFEHLASDAVIAGGGRVVKLIGDEVMYTALDPGSACSIALDLASTFGDHAVVPAVRAGLADGPVMLRDGDVFGPVVNLAARIVKVAQPNEVLTTADVCRAAGLRSETRGHHRLKGITDDVELRRLLRI